MLIDILLYSIWLLVGSKSFDEKSLSAKIKVLDTIDFMDSFVEIRHNLKQNPFQNVLALLKLSQMRLFTQVSQIVL